MYWGNFLTQNFEGEVGGAGRFIVRNCSRLASFRNQWNKRGPNQDFEISCLLGMLDLN